MAIKINSKSKVDNTPLYRELTIENLKTLFINQMFMVSSKDEADDNVGSIEKYFKDIEKDSCDIKGLINCDTNSFYINDILQYLCEAKFGISSGNLDMNIIKEAMLHSGDVARFIEDFSRELSFTFALHKNLLSMRK